MWIRKHAVEELSQNIRRIVDGESVEMLDNREGKLSILRNDIQTLVRLKQEQANALLEDKEKLKDSLSDISHQLKTPLTSMMVMADLLETAPPEKQQELIRNIQTGLTRTQWLTDALLKMAKLDADAVDFNTRTVSAKEIVARALEPLRVLLEMKEQAVITAGEATILCDLRWTAEALGNVIKNASEHSPAGKPLLIGCGENPISAWISVTDSGEGLQSIEIHRLFRRFQGGDGSAGYGIGLPLAQAIMRRQNGDIEADSGSYGLPPHVAVLTDLPLTGATFTLKVYR
ncbi:MAG TPA: HAMP domain-containing sensor histidine kinase [Candidatus Limiplasma sp.]|nr:HAMP domain-containing sensor histidine kinase [Candidatus Limiplasma sp.]